MTAGINTQQTIGSATNKLLIVTSFARVHCGNPRPACSFSFPGTTSVFENPRSAVPLARQLTSCVSSLLGQQLFEPGAVEPHHNFAVDHSYRGSHHADFQQFVHRRLVIHDIPFYKWDIPLRKELLRHLTKVSTVRLGVDENFSRHGISSYVIRKGFVSLRKALREMDRLLALEVALFDDGADGPSQGLTIHQPGRAVP